MKRLLSGILVLTLILSCPACGRNAEQTEITSGERATSVSDTESESEETGAGEDEGENMQNVLVAYFSATGTTKALAETAADLLNADTYEILPQDPYTDEDLAYYTGGRADKEQNDPSARPEISGSVETMGQ